MAPFAVPDWFTFAVHCLRRSAGLVPRLTRCAAILACLLGLAAGQAKATTVHATMGIAVSSHDTLPFTDSAPCPNLSSTASCYSLLRQALNITTARFAIAWDANATEEGYLRTALAQAHATGISNVYLTITASANTKVGPPSSATYTSDVTNILAWISANASTSSTYAPITAVGAYNEPEANCVSAPQFATYFKDLQSADQAAHRSDTIVAGDFQHASGSWPNCGTTINETTYLNSFKSSLGSVVPKTWAIHFYDDLLTLGSGNTNAFMGWLNNAYSGFPKVWLTEGGTLLSSSSCTTCNVNANVDAQQKSAADFLNLPTTSSVPNAQAGQISREYWYYYEDAPPQSDSALLDAGGLPRPGFWTFNRRACLRVRREHPNRDDQQSRLRPGPELAADHWQLGRQGSNRSRPLRSHRFDLLPRGPGRYAAGPKLRRATRRGAPGHLEGGSLREPGLDPDYGGLESLGAHGSG